MPANKSIIRLQLSTTANPSVAMVDFKTGVAPQIWRGGDATFQIGIFDQNGNVVDVSDLDFLEVDIYPLETVNLAPGAPQQFNPFSQTPYPSLPPAPLLFVTIPKADIDSDMTLQQWQAGVAQQASAVFTWVQTVQLNLNGQPQLNFWLVVSGFENGVKTIYGGGMLTVFESGVQGIYLPNNLAPIDVPEDTILYIPPNQQMTFHTPISIEGTVVINDGSLIQV